MDTTTVDYAMDNVINLYEKMLPNIQIVSEKLIYYYQSEIIISFISAVLILIVSLIVLSIGIKYGKKCNWDDESYLIPLIIGSISSTVCIILISINFYSGLMIYFNPEVYTARQIIKEIQN